MKLKGRHKALIVVGLLAMIAAWFSWNMLLVESEAPPPIPLPADAGP